MAVCVEKRNVRWLASYPKSGNTWVRAFFTSYLASRRDAAHINALNGHNAAGRDVLDSVSAVEASEFSDDEIDRYRPDIYRTLGNRLDPVFIKVHDAYGFNDRGAALFPPEITFAAIYLVRNPLDVAVSFSHHDGSSIDRIIDFMCRPDAVIDASGDRPGSGVRSRILSWSDNVKSWVDCAQLAVNVVRYEDLVLQPRPAFERLLSIAGLEFAIQPFERALAFSDFANLQQQEISTGFRERHPRSSSPFFRNGRIGGWQETLSAAQIQRLVDAHGATMQRFGYLNA